MKPYTLRMFALCLLNVSMLHAQNPDGDDGYALFEQSGRMVKVAHGAQLSLYCAGNGSPTVVLESGFGGATYEEWRMLQPRLAKETRTCSYDRAGYGFSKLGADLPRNIQHDVLDLHALLKASGERGPYVLVGHSDGGHIIGAYTDLYPAEVAALVFLDAAVLLDKEQINGSEEKPSAETQRYYDAQLAKISGCLKRAGAAHGMMEARPGDDCLDSKDTVSLPPRMAKALSAIAARPDSWKAYLSEAQQHYVVDDVGWEASLLPHHWQHLPVRVFTASVASLDDEHSAPLYGLKITDHAAIAEARRGRERWESLQKRICDFSEHCTAIQIATAMHEVQNAVPDQVAAAVREIILQVRDAGR
jgi:pimeloyl-ACP methyl ester carboxylesterase